MSHFKSVLNYLWEDTCVSQLEYSIWRVLLELVPSFHLYMGSDGLPGFQSKWLYLLSHLAIPNTNIVGIIIIYVLIVYEYICEYTQAWTKVKGQFTWVGSPVSNSGCLLGDKFPTHWSHFTGYDLIV